MRPLLHCCSWMLALVHVGRDRPIFFQFSPPVSFRVFKKKARPPATRRAVGQPVFRAWFTKTSWGASSGWLVGGFNPSEKYARQIGSFPQIGVKMKNIWNNQPFNMAAFNIMGSGNPDHQKNGQKLNHFPKRSYVELFSHDHLWNTKLLGFWLVEKDVKRSCFLRLTWCAWKKCVPKIFLPNGGEFNGEFHPMGSNP